MASSNSAKKRIRQNEKRRARNRAAIRTFRTEDKKFISTLESGDSERAESLMRSQCRRLDKMVTKGIIRKGTAARRKSRLSLKFNASKQA